MAGKRGKGGRPPKPVPVRIADGTHRNDRHGSVDALVQPAEAPEKPHFENAAAADLWDTLVAELIELGVAKSTDAALLQSMCEMWGLYRAAYSVAEQDPTDKDARIAVTSYWAKFETAASRCGMNPTDRGRLRINKPDKGGVRRRQG